VLFLAEKAKTVTLTLTLTVQATSVLLEKARNDLKRGDEKTSLLESRLAAASEENSILKDDLDVSYKAATAAAVEVRSLEIEMEEPNPNPNPNWR